MRHLYAIAEIARQGSVRRAAEIVHLSQPALTQALAQAEEITQALARFKAQGKFVIAQTTGFQTPGLGDYLAATAANEIWVQPKSDFSVSGAGAGGRPLMSA